ncbi:hypothetical protein AB6A40_010978 [Gnathostoma spinigerum]|uniref:Secreted protein n=1 Tax=Gnathostoma spinigerum TaxID=75299 RepID=A0ABD6EWE0_9BILA
MQACIFSDIGDNIAALSMVFFRTLLSLIIVPSSLLSANGYLLSPDGQQLLHVRDPSWSSPADWFPPGASSWYVSGTHNFPRRADKTNRSLPFKGHWSPVKWLRQWLFV